MDENRYLIHTADLDPDRKVSYRLYLKDSIKSLFFLIAGILCTLFVPHLLARILGGILILLPLVNLFVIKDRILLEGNGSEVIAYDLSDPDLAFRFTFDDVLSYGFDKNQLNQEYYRIDLKEDVTVVVPTNKNSLLTYFRKHIPEKERLTQLRQRFQEKMKKKK